MIRCASRNEQDRQGVANRLVGLIPASVSSSIGTLTSAGQAITYTTAVTSSWQYFGRRLVF